MSTTGYLSFSGIIAARLRSRTAALARGCQPGDVTQFWWEVRQHPLVPGTFLLLMDDTRPLFSKLILAIAERATVESDPAVLAALDGPTETAP